MAIVCKSAAEIERMRKSGRIVRQVLDHVKALVTPGATTMDLERAAEKRIKELGAKPAFKGYYDYPCVLCTSVNEEIVHGIPSEKRVLKEGDIVSIDCGVVLDGYYGDAAITVPVGDGLKPELRKLLDVTETSLYRGLNRRGSATRWAMSAPRYSSTWKQPASAWCANSSDTASERGCMKSRRFRTLAIADTARSCAKAWCWQSSPW